MQIVQTLRKTWKRNSKASKSNHLRFLRLRDTNTFSSIENDSRSHTCGATTTAQGTKGPPPPMICLQSEASGRIDCLASELIELHVFAHKCCPYCAINKPATNTINHDKSLTPPPQVDILKTKACSSSRDTLVAQCDSQLPVVTLGQPRESVEDSCAFEKTFVLGRLYYLKYCLVGWTVNDVF